MTLDKLPGIRGDLVQTDPDWEKWDFAKLSKAIRLWLRRNPADIKSSERDFNEHRIPKWGRSNKLYKARGLEFNPKECVYCGKVGHKPSDCQKTTKVDEGRICVLIAPHLIIVLWNVTAKPHVNIARNVITRQFATVSKHSKLERTIRKP